MQPYLNMVLFSVRHDTDIILRYSTEWLWKGDIDLAQLSYQETILRILFGIASLVLKISHDWYTTNDEYYQNTTWITLNCRV